MLLRHHQQRPSRKWARSMLRLNSTLRPLGHHMRLSYPGYTCLPSPKLSKDLSPLLLFIDNKPSLQHCQARRFDRKKCAACLQPLRCRTHRQSPHGQQPSNMSLVISFPTNKPPVASNTSLLNSTSTSVNGGPVGKPLWPGSKEGLVLLSR